MTNILVGDLDPISLYEQLTNKPFELIQLLKKEDNLVNLYRHNINDGAKVLRIISAKINPNQLANQNVSFDLESCLNLAVSQAKKAKLQSDILIAGVLSIKNNLNSLIDIKNLTDYQLEAAINQAIIMLDDFQVDCFVLQDITDLDLLIKTTRICTKLTNLPLAIFWQTAEYGTLDQFKKLTSLIDNYKLECVGIQCFAVKLSGWLTYSKIPLSGLIIEDIQNLTNQQLDQIKKKDFTLIFAGYNSKRLAWQEFISKCN